jgi:hypothetical protein
MPSDPTGGGQKEGIMTGFTKVCQDAPLGRAEFFTLETRGELESIWMRTSYVDGANAENRRGQRSFFRRV